MPGKKDRSAFTLEEMLALKALRERRTPLTDEQKDIFRRLINLSLKERRDLLDAAILFNLVEKDEEKARILRLALEGVGIA